MKLYSLLTISLKCVIFHLAIICSITAPAQIITTILGNGSGTFAGDGGAATAASINIAWGVAVDNAGNIYVGDGSNNRVRKINTSGIVTTIAGTGSSTYGGDGGAATAAQLFNPSGLAIDTSGNIFISDANNHRVRKINTSGIITTYAGTGTGGYSGDGGPATAAQFYYSDGIAADKYGNVFIPDPTNHRLRRVNASGIISTFAGTGTSGYSGDGGPATSANIDYPSDVEVDFAGNVYFTDYNRQVVRKVNTSGIITTVAGNGSAGFSGDGGPATSASLRDPTGIDVDNCGNIYISDRTNSRVRMVSCSGIITTITGTASATFSGDGGLATAASINYPHGICHDAMGNILIVDRLNYRVRKISYLASHAPRFTRGDTASIHLCAGSPPSSINSLLPIIDSDISQCEDWNVGVAPLHGTLAGFTYTTVSTGSTITPAGLTYTPSSAYSGIDSFKIVVSDCKGADTFTIYAIISPAPSPGIITGPDSVCAGATIMLADTASAGIWSSSNSLATITATGIVTGIAPGIDTILYTISTGCGISYALYYVYINPQPDAGVISGPVSVCISNTIILISSGPAGGIWSAKNAHATVAGGVVTAVSPGIDTIYYSVTNSCGTAKTPYIITVYPVPAAPAVTTPLIYCQGTTAIPLTASGSGLLWYMAATGGTGAATPITPSTTTIGSTFYYVSQSPHGCESPRSPIEVKVITKGMISFDYVVKYHCGVDSVIFNNTSQYCDYYKWDFGNGTTSADGSITVTHLYPGASLANDYVVKLRGGNIYCGDDSLSVTVHLAASPIVSFLTNVTASDTILYANSLQLNASGGYIYNWMPDDGSLSNPNINNPIAKPVTTTTYTVYAYNNDGCLDTANVTVTVVHNDKEIVPSAFSPNGDGLNDVFRIKALTNEKLVGFSIYNRWGELVFETINIEKGWDGYYKSQPQDMGIYNYFIITALTDGSNKTYKGTVTLIR